MALGALSAITPASAADPSQWKCELCPFETGTSATTEIGAGAVSDDSAAFGDFTGLQRRGLFAVAGGTLRHRSADGLWADVSAADLGLDTRSLAARGGREGQFSLRLGYAESPHHLTDTASTPFLGVPGATLTLPAGFPAATTAAMPLATTLQPVDIGFKRTRVDLGGAWIAPEAWSVRVSARHEVRDGTQRSAGSFFSTTSQLVAPVDQTTDQVEVAATYADRKLEATLAYRASLFRNGTDSLTWSNPFTAPVAGATTGQLALAPDNEFHQVSASAGYAFGPGLRVSGELAVGRMTQNAPYLAATLNSSLVVPPLPANSLDGRVATLDASLRLSATPLERLRLTATYTHNDHDNQTPVAAYPAVSTDLFVGALSRTNQPYSFKRDHLALAADYTGPRGWKLSGGADEDAMHRTLQETGTTHETTLWARAAAKPRRDLSLSLKLAHADRRVDDYSVVAAIQPPENPLLRKYNQADRTRDSAHLRADFAASETINLGATLDLSNDDYAHSVLGLVHGHAAGFGADASFAISDDTQLHAYAQSEQTRAEQRGSQSFGLPDWTGRSRDSVDLLGVGMTHLALKGKLELTADLMFARSHSSMVVDTGASSPPLPTATTSRDSLKLQAIYHVNPKMSVVGRFWHERYDASDWRLDGVLPASVPNLLAFGEQPPRYGVSVLQLALRYAF